MEQIRKNWPILTVLATVIIQATIIYASVETLGKELARQKEELKEHSKMPMHDAARGADAALSERIVALEQSRESHDSRLLALHDNLLGISAQGADVKVLATKLEGMDELLREVRTDMKEVLSKSN